MSGQRLAWFQTTRFLIIAAIGTVSLGVGTKALEHQRWYNFKITFLYCYWFGFIIE